MKRTFIIIFLSLIFIQFELEARRIAVIFGTNYQGNNSGIPPLELCEADAKLMEQTLKTHGKFDEARVLLGKMVTATNVKNSLEELAKIVTKEDTIFLYFSGHGTYQRDNSAPNGMRNYLVMYNRPHISDKELNDWLAVVKGKKVWVFDCCFSGGIVKKGKNTRGAGDIPIPENSPGVVLQNADDNFYFKDAVLIGSSDANETSIEIRGNVNQGLFTYYFSQALNPLNGDLNNDKTVSLYEAFEWSSSRVTEHARKLNHKQNPQLRGDAKGYLISGNFVPVQPTPETNVVSPQPNEEPPVVDQGNYGKIELITTILKSRQAGQNTMDPVEILRKNKLGDVERKIRISVSGQEVKSKIQWLTEKELSLKAGDEIPLGEYSYNSQAFKNRAAYIIIEKVPTGVHEVILEAEDYPKIKEMIGVEKGKTAKTLIVASLSNYGSIQGKVFYKNFEQPMPGVEVWMPTVTGVNLVHKMKTTKEGSFWFLNLPPGDYYQLKVSFLESTDLDNRYLKVKAGEVTRVDAVLKIKNVLDNK